MKHKLILIMMVIATLFCQAVVAQLPKTSTSDKPSWYYIQVVGEGASREDRVFVAQDGYLYGETLSATKDAQLFRFEKNDDKYFVISKSTGEKLDVGKKDNEECLSLSENGIGFTLDPLADFYYNITASSTPEGGDASKKWAHQSNNNSSYKIILVSSTWSGETNSQFMFIPYEEINLEYSVNASEIWYRINSAKPGNEDLCFTDVSKNSDYMSPLALTLVTENEKSQLWKLVKNGSTVELINKETGNAISTESEIIDSHLKFNFTQITNNASNSKWTIAHQREGQYTISTVEKDNITRYLNASLLDQNPEEYDASKLVRSGFAWKFKKAPDSEQTGISTVIVEDNVFVYSENRRIIVEGAVDYTVRTVQGMIIDKNRELPIGVYLVTVNGKTTKILVK